MGHPQDNRDRYREQSIMILTGSVDSASGVGVSSIQAAVLWRSLMIIDMVHYNHMTLVRVDRTLD